MRPGLRTEGFKGRRRMHPFSTLTRQNRLCERRISRERGPQKLEREREREMKRGKKMKTFHSELSDRLLFFAPSSHRSLKPYTCIRSCTKCFLLFQIRENLLLYFKLERIKWNQENKSKRIKNSFHHQMRSK